MLVVRAPPNVSPRPVPGVESATDSRLEQTRSGAQSTSLVGRGQPANATLAALLAAVEIQRELAAQEVSVRIGVHVGELLVEPERLSGDAVNIAARIRSRRPAA